jgi:3-hydroxyisobutyrate dehydrogenase/2-hydroxy-3-oxopropionate reductase
VSAFAFCGLGQMGAPMAARLLEAGDEVAVWNRSPERAEPLVERGARRAASPAEAAKEVDAVFTMLATPDAVEDVVLGPDGVVHGVSGGSTVIEMSTIGPAAVGRIAAGLPDGVGLLDAPVLGSVRQATDGSLKIFVGGEAGLFERWRPVLEQLGTPRHVGPQGAGAAMKLVANVCLGVLMTGLGEALALARALGLQQGNVLDVLAESPIGATVQSKRSNIESGEFAPNFKLELAAKDLRLVAQEAEAAGVHLKVAEAAKVWLEAAEQAGLGDQDYSAVIEKILVSSGS